MPGAYQQTVSVQLDGNTIWSGQPSISWNSYHVNIGNLAAGSHTLGFVGTNLHGALDTTAFLDNVSLSAVGAVPEPESYAMLLAGLGLVGFGKRRRCQA